MSWQTARETTENLLELGFDPGDASVIVDDLKAIASKMGGYTALRAEAGTLKEKWRQLVQMRKGAVNDRQKNYLNHLVEVHHPIEQNIATKLRAAGLDPGKDVTSGIVLLKQDHDLISQSFDSVRRRMNLSSTHVDTLNWDQAIALTEHGYASAVARAAEDGRKYLIGGLEAMSREALEVLRAAKMSQP